MSEQIAITAQEDAGRSSRSVLIWGLLFIVVAGCRLLLPMHDSDTMMVHEAIVESLVLGHNWGRQALVGALEYPLLPTLGLLSVRTLIGAPYAGMVLVAVSQAWALCYLLRVRRSPIRRLVLLGLVVLFAAVLPDIRAAVLALDPNWVAAVPFCGAFYHLVRWFRSRQLRDAVLAAVNCGLLVFCGLVGIAAGVALLVVLSRDVKLASAEESLDTRGVPSIIWAPIVYCLALWLLWNWLVLGDLLFTLRRLIGAVLHSPLFLIPVRTFWALVFGPVSLWACAALAAVGLLAGRKRGVIAVLVTAAVVALVRALCIALGIFSGAGTILVVAAALLVLATVGRVRLSGQTSRQKHARLALALAAVLLFITDMTVAPVPDPVQEGAFSAGAPPAESITALVDRYWPRSRTAVYGVRLPALYHDPAETRFVARMDYHEQIFLDQAADEVMHMLIPPPDGRFYSPGSVFADIYQHGRPHLLLEKRWRNGWQLWRCVIFPDDESRLKHLE